MQQHSFHIHEVLKEYWGYDSFRPLQEEVIGSVLAGKDTLALMPTGGGKSLCYQVPAMAMKGLCLVISPLIALMKDQVGNLRRKGITAYAIYSGMSRKEVINTLEVASRSNCRFLYVSPERLESKLFKEYLPGLPVQLIAVDEAHCISQWGYDFRPPYLRIAALREELPGIPVLALTASATPAVQKDITDKLAFTNFSIYRQSFERANLSYSVFRVDSKINKLISILQKVAGTAIVYCKSRKRCRDISDLLRMQQIGADFYHAGLIQEERNRKQEAWIQNKTRVIVCTNAFGMGIDKPDVRTVIHADIPDCLENYYQEAGRAGRDGKTAYAVLLYEERDLERLHEMAMLRFPSPDEVREVYQSVVNYLQIPSGTGGGQYYDFDLADFLKKFSLQGHPVLYALKTLEQENWLSFNEQVFLPSTVMFAVNKDTLYAFEKEHPEMDDLIKTLLRSYEGIYDQPVPVSEKQIAGILKLDPDSVKKELTRLEQYQIIDYRPQKENPQIYFHTDRIRAEDIAINEKALEERKTQFLKRMRQMIDFVQEDVGCRSVIIGRYFGDQQIRSCGICDNCLKQKSTTLTREEFESLQHRIINIVKYEPVTAKELLQKLGDVQKEKAWKVIEHLQAEQKIETDAAGRVLLK